MQKPHRGEYNGIADFIAALRCALRSLSWIAQPLDALDFVTDNETATSFERGVLRCKRSHLWGSVGQCLHFKDQAEGVRLGLTEGAAKIADHNLWAGFRGGCVRLLEQNVLRLQIRIHHSPRMHDRHSALHAIAGGVLSELKTPLGAGIPMTSSLAGLRFWPFTLSLLSELQAGVYAALQCILGDRSLPAADTRCHAGWRGAGEPRGWQSRTGSPAGRGIGVPIRGRCGQHV